MGLNHVEVSGTGAKHVTGAVVMLVIVSVLSALVATVAYLNDYLRRILE